jgi:hypothetical protein
MDDKYTIGLGNFKGAIRRTRVDDYGFHFDSRALLFSDAFKQRGQVARLV